MLKQELVNYFKSFKHFFTPLGTLFLGLLLGLSVLVTGTVNATETLVNGIKGLAEGVNLDFATLWEKLRAAIVALNWNDPVEAVKTMLSSEWLNDVLTQSLNTVLGSDFNTFAGQIKTLINTYVNKICSLAGVAVFFLALGFIAGFMLTKFFVRRNIAKRSVWKWLLSSIVNALVSLGILIAVISLYVTWKPSAIFTPFILIIVQTIQAIITAYLVYAYKKVKFSQVMTAKNVGLSILGNFLIILFSAAFTFLAMLINVPTGFFVGLAIFEIAFCVITMNAESYVRELVCRNVADGASDAEIQTQLSA